LPETSGDLGNTSNGPAGDFDNELVRRVRLGVDVRVVQPIEQPNGDPAQTLVPVDKGMTGDNRMEQAFR
jgi:hypothetical protein